MPKDKRSFFERLTGAVRIDDYEDAAFDDGVEEAAEPREKGTWIAEEDGDGELAIDVHQTRDEIVIKTMVAGVKPEDLDISITHDMVTIQGKREAERTVNDDDYFHQELYWGSFSRTVLLPQEVDAESAEAIEKHGLLIIKLPKLNKDKQTKLRVKTG